MSTPIVALRRREEALRKFSSKIKKLEELLDAGTIERVPNNLRPTSFVEWEDQELGIQKFSRNSLYETDEKYTALHSQMHGLLEALAKIRSKARKKEDLTQKLRDRAEAAERKLQVCVNDYAAARTELEEKNKEITRLRLQVDRLREHSQKVTRLRPVKTTHDGGER